MAPVPSTGGYPGSGGAGSPAAGGTGTAGTGAGAPAVFKPAPAAFRRLTSSAFRNSLRDLLGGRVTVGELEPDSWTIAGLPTVGAAEVSVSPRGVELYQAAIEAAVTQVFSDAARRNTVLGCQPKSATDTECFEAFVTAFGRRAFRQALTPGQVDRYTTLIAASAATLGDAYEGMRAGMTAVLLSPNFLYRMERGAPSDAGVPGAWQYTGSEVASRLSYFLTNTIPDAQLLDAAEQGGLRSAAQIREQAARLLETEAGRESVANFALELFRLPTLAGRPKDASFSDYTPTLNAGMVQELPAMFQALVFDRNASALELFTTRNTFVTKELAALYGLNANVGTTGLTPVTLPADGPRAGVMGTAAMLSLLGTQKEGSPTLRGRFIREVFLCQTVLPPPVGVNTMLPDLPPGVVMTKRERLTKHLVEPSCAGCHGLMDPLGFPLENFDAIGKYRQTDHGKPIDATGTLMGTDFDGPIELGEVLASLPETAACMVRNLYRYGTGHIESREEAATTLSELVVRFQAGGYNLRTLMMDLVASDGFRYVAPSAE